MLRKVIRTMHLLICFLFTLILPSLITSCANVNSLPRSNLNASGAVKEPDKEVEEEYILQAGDVIDIKFFYNPELNELVTIRPDRKISLQLIDEVVAAGLTPSELVRVLTDNYSNKLRYAEVTVIVREMVGQKVYVGGEVNSAGLIPISGKLTSIQAILHAGGFKNTAELKSVVILRDQGTENPLFMTINLEEDLTTRTPHNDILLEPHDIIFVPKTSIAKMSHFVDQYIKELIPVTLTFGLVYNMNPEVEVK